MEHSTIQNSIETAHSRAIGKQLKPQDSRTYRTDFFTSDEIEKTETSARSQETRILNFLRANCDTLNRKASEHLGRDVFGSYGASQIWEELAKDREQVGSFRRALTMLSADGIIEMTNDRIKSAFGASEHLWKLK